MVATVIAGSPDQLLAPVRSLLEEEYGLPVADVTHLATHSNVLFRVDLSDGRRLVLRVGQPAVNTLTNLQIEVQWLSTLVRDSRLHLSEPVATPDGRLVVQLGAPGGPRCCVLFTWVPGEPIGNGAGTSGYRAMGRVAGLLHGHGSWRPSHDLVLRRWDRTFYYPEDVDPLVIEDFRYDHLFAGLRPLLRRVADHCDAFIARRWGESLPMVVHGDLHEWNVHLHMGRPFVIDFEDVMLALPAQDIATSLYGARTRDDLEALVAAFRQGYQEERVWPVQDREELEGYWAARQVMLMNHAARILPEAEARNYFQQVVPWLRSFDDRAAAHRSG